MLVRKAMADGLPATIYRPGIVVGDSTTGATQKYDGALLPRHLPAPPAARSRWCPRSATATGCEVCVVPRDFVVDAMDVLSVLDRSAGRTYALTDPEPPSVRELVTAFAGHLGKRLVWVPLPLRPVHLLVGSVPGMERLIGLPAEALDYFASPTTYATAQTTTDLEGTGVTCPPFASLRRPPARLHARPPRGRRPRHGLSRPGARPGGPVTPTTATTSPTDAPQLVVNVSLTGSERDYDAPGDLPRPDASASCARAPTATSTRPATWCATGRAARTPIAVTGVREARAAGPVRRRPRRRREGDGGRRRRGAGHRRPRRCATCCRSGRSGTCRPRCRATSTTPARSCSAAPTTTARCGCCGSHTDNLEFADPLLRFDLAGHAALGPRCSASPATRRLAGAPPARRRARPAAGARPGLEPRAGPQGRARLRRRGGDLRRARRASGSTTSPARRSSPRRSPTSGSTSSAGAASTWCSTRPRSPSTSPSPRPCSRR